MVTRAQIVAEARTWINTPFEHQGRLKGVGVDCAGVVIGVARALGLSNYDIDGYARTPSRSQLERELDANMDRIDPRQAREADVLLLRIDYDPQHLAIITTMSPLSMVHSFARRGVSRCVEHRIDQRWANRVIRAYRYRGIEQ